MACQWITGNQIRFVSGFKSFNWFVHRIALINAETLIRVAIDLRTLVNSSIQCISRTPLVMGWERAQVKLKLERHSSDVVWHFGDDQKKTNGKWPQKTKCMGIETNVVRF